MTEDPTYNLEKILDRFPDDARADFARKELAELQAKVAQRDWLIANLEVVDGYEGCDGNPAIQCELILTGLHREDAGDDLAANIAADMARQKD